MKKIGIFEISNKKLFAAQYEWDTKNAFELLQDEWSDTELLRTFFKQYDQDYKDFFGYEDVNTRVRNAISEAEYLFEHLLDLCENDLDLNNLFKPLDNRELDKKAYELQKLKGKGDTRKTFLRIYGIRYKDTVVITGGAIKLTLEMKVRPHTKFELIKLDKVREFLENIDNEGQFVYLEI